MIKRSLFVAFCSESLHDQVFDAIGQEPAQQRQGSGREALDVGGDITCPKPPMFDVLSQYYDSIYTYIIIYSH